MTTERRFSWKGYEAKQLKLQTHATKMKALGDQIDERYGDTYAASNGIVLAIHGKSTVPLFIAYAEESNAIHELCKTLINEDNLDWTVVTDEYQTIAFPHTMLMWKKNIASAMAESEKTTQPI